MQKLKVKKIIIMKKLEKNKKKEFKSKKSLLILEKLL